ncbi:hypothetical protein, partial [Lactococcus petauri]|uniref:hypothetical protein n=1 Tax=Lactococcus petauri TaxID=1940789 RepID=UPI0021F1678D
QQALDQLGQAMQQIGMNQQAAHEATVQGQQQIMKGVFAPRRVTAQRGPDGKMAGAISTVEGME